MYVRSFRWAQYNGEYYAKRELLLPFPAIVRAFYNKLKEEKKKKTSSIYARAGNHFIRHPFCALTTTCLKFFLQEEKQK